MPRKKPEPAGEAGTPDISSELWPIPAEWRWARVSDVGAVKLGRQLAASKRRNSKATPYLRAANIGVDGLDLANVLKMDLTERERGTLKLLRGDVVLSEASGSPDQVGKSAVWNEEIPDCCFQNTVVRFRPHALLSDYSLVVFRYFQEAGVFARASHGVGIQHLGASRFAQLDVPVPGLAEQARIVEEVNSRIAEVMTATASMDSALRGIEEQVTIVIEAAATGQADTDERTAASGAALPLGKRPDTTNERLARVTIPGSWEWATVAGVGEVRNGKKREPKHEQGSNIVPYLRVANVFEDRIDGTNLLTMNFTPEEQEIYRLRPNDILLNEGQSAELVGRPAMYHGEPENVCFQNHLLRFRATSAVNPEFALLVFRFYLRSGVFQSIAKLSTNIATLGLQRCSELPFPLPPFPVQRKLVTWARKRLAELEGQKATVLASRKGVEEMRRGILAAAVRGELTKRDASEESAADMLRRLGSPPKEAALPRLPRPKASDEEEEPGDDHQDLTEALKENGGRLKVAELFSNARYKKDHTREFAAYYLALRDKIGKTIRVAGSDGEDSILEVIPDEA